MTITYILYSMRQWSGCRDNVKYCNRKGVRGLFLLRRGIHNGDDRKLVTRQSNEDVKPKNNGNETRLKNIKRHNLSQLKTWKNPGIMICSIGIYICLKCLRIKQRSCSTNVSDRRAIQLSKVKRYIGIYAFTYRLIFRYHDYHKQN